MGRTTYNRLCECCGVQFVAYHPNGKYCNVNCKMNASYYRRAGRPIPGHLRVAPAAVQPEILDDLPLAWRDAEPAPASALEVREWNGTPIHRRDADGFVSATAMCQAGGKRLNHYLANERTQEYIRALAASVAGEKPCGAVVAGNPADLFQGSTGNPADLIRMVTTGLNEQRGTWIHPRLAVDLARWISPAFAVWMDGWFLESLERKPERPAAAQPSNKELCGLWLTAIELDLQAALNKAFTNARSSLT
jgi:hypothetical protein